MMLMPWWKRLPGRLLEEDAALANLREGETPVLSAYRWVRESDGEPRVRAVLDIAARSVELEVRFPAHYPEACPSVRPMPYESLSSHQFGGTGILCLELGPDNWHPHYTAADMIESAWRLLAYETINAARPIEIPSRHVPDLVERVRLGSGVLLRTEEFDSRVLAAAENTEFEFVWPARNLVRVFPVAFPKGEALTDVPPALGEESHSPGLLVRLDEDAPNTVPSESVAFSDYVSVHGRTPLAADSPLVVLLQWPNQETRAFVRFSKKVRELVNMPLETSFDTRTPEQLRERLSALKVGVVGLGSLGSRVALSLARAGVRRWVLVDGDVLEGPNLCRFPAGFADIGAMKVDVVKEAIRDLSPSEPETTSWPVNIASATNPDLHAHVLEDLGSADILVDATANAEVFGLMAMLASDRRRPLVWGEVFGGGIGGLVASAHPEHDPCPRCVRAGFLAAASTWPPAPGKDVDEPYAGGEESPVVATDADVAAIGAALANRVIDIVRAEPPPPAVTLLGLRRAWIFDIPMQTVPVPIRTDDWSCPRCWRLAAEPDAETAARAEALFSQNEHANDSDPR
jgi:sulfur-carrier protein adenylyltransferase/sulfurtransferase